MSQELQELREMLFQLERKLRPLEWDLGRKQINEFKKQELVRLKAEQGQLLQRLKDLEKE